MAPIIPTIFFLFFLFSFWVTKVATTHFIIMNNYIIQRTKNKTLVERDKMLTINNVHFAGASVTRDRFTLQWSSPPVMSSRGILKFDWPRATLLSGGRLHYNQESFGGEHCTWMKIWYGCQHGDTFFGGGSSPEGKYLGHPESLGQ